jgi:hypothetical protein
MNAPSASGTPPLSRPTASAARFLRVKCEISGVASVLDKEIEAPSRLGPRCGNDAGGTALRKAVPGIRTRPARRPRRREISPATAAVARVGHSWRVIHSKL